MTGFEGFVAIDWSGAEGRYSGISVARCGPGVAAPRLVAPQSARWTRAAIADWLERAIRSGQRLLIGLDFAFGMPFEPRAGYLGGRAKGVDDVFGLWDLLDAASGAEDFGVGKTVTDPRFAPLFWQSGKQPKGWIARQRRTEIECALATGTRPECVFKLIGSKQVGKASLTGMRVLRHVRTRNAGRMSVWPFERPGAGTVLVEIYPTLFRKQTAGGLAKLRTNHDLDAALRHLGSKGIMDTDEDLSDDETDAMISAAGLRSLAGNGWVRLPEPACRRIRYEGWIFGVKLPLAKPAPA